MCQLCETKPVYEFTNQRKLCKTCFIRWFQKKVLYTIRKFRMIKKGDVIAYKKSSGFRGIVLEDVLKMFAEKAPVEIVELNNKCKKVSKIAIASTTDLEANKIIHFLIKVVNKLETAVEGRHQAYPKVLHTGAKIIKPLYLFLDKEVLLYAKLRGLKFKKIDVELDEISKFVNELEIKHPEVKQAVVSSWLGR